VFLSGGTKEHELALRNAQAADELLPLVGPFAFMLRAHLTEQMRHEQVTMSELRSAARLPGKRHVTVCFADLVAYTRLGRAPGPRSGRARRHRTWSGSPPTSSNPLRLVKVIGDAVMLVSLEAERVVETALELVERATESADTEFPPLRAGVACATALNRSGDWYGRPVNLASRITQAAPAGSVLCAQEVREAIGEDYRWSKYGSRTFKGVECEVGPLPVER
jgi:adenylate cyclase